jgi:hypothetical protein
MSTQLANHPRGSQVGQSIASKDSKGSQAGIVKVLGMKSDRVSVLAGQVAVLTLPDTR